MNSLDMKELLDAIETQGWKLDYVYLDYKSNRFELEIEEWKYVIK